MSRRPKLDYDFCPLPRKRHPAWAGVSLHMKGLMLSLFELHDGEPIPVDGDWLESLCKQMCIGGRDRPNVRKALLELHGKGVLTVSSATVAVAFFPHDQLTPIDVRSTSPQRPLDVPSTSGRPPLDVPLESSDRNHSTHKTQTDRQTDKQRENAGARPPARSISSRPDIIGFNFVASLLGRDAFSIAPLGSFPAEYRWIGTRPANERDAVAKAVAADEWCTTNPGHVDAPHLQKGWQKYLNGRPKPVAKASHQPQLLIASGAYREL